MRLRLRLLLTLIRALFFSKRIDISETSVLKFRVWLNDVDVSQVTADRYHAYMDLGRIEFVARLGLIKPMVRKGWRPRARHVTIRNRHPLKLLQRFELHSSVVHWDDKWFWFKQEFIFEGRTTSISYGKLGLATRKGIVPSAKILGAAGQLTDSPPWPVAEYLHFIEEDLRTHQR